VRVLGSTKAILKGPLAAAEAGVAAAGASVVAAGASVAGVVLGQAVSTKAATNKSTLRVETERRLVLSLSGSVYRGRSVLKTKRG
jgi:hypothetical protein